LDPENAIASYTAGVQSTGSKVLQIPTELLADENGKISNITFRKILDDPDQEKAESGAFVDYIMFSHYSVLEEDELTNCTADHLKVLYADEYMAAVPEENHSTWGCNYHLSQLAGTGFYNNYEGAEDGSVFKLSWDAVHGLLYPGVMFSFPTQGEVDATQDIVVRMYVSGSLQPGANLWFTSRGSLLSLLY